MEWWIIPIYNMVVDFFNFLFDMNILEIGEIHLFYNKDEMKYNLGRLTKICKGDIINGNLFFSNDVDTVVYEMNNKSYYKDCKKLPVNLLNKINELAYKSMIKKRT